MLIDKKNEEFFNRCEYSVYRHGIAIPKREVFVVRNYAAGDPCIDACIEYWERDVPSDIRVREIRSNADSILPDAVEFVFIKTGDVVVKICDFVADPKDYTANELIANPSLVQATDVEEFIRFYRSR